MRTLLALLLLVSSAYAQTDLDMALALAKAKSEIQHVSAAPHYVPNVRWDAAQGTFVTDQGSKWDSAGNRWISSDGKLWVEKGGTRWKPLEEQPAPLVWRPVKRQRVVEVPAQYRMQRVKVCYGTHCEYKLRRVMVAPPRRQLINETVYEKVPAPVESSLPAEQQPTPPEGVDAGLRLLAPQPHELFVEFGSGHTAPWCVKAVRDFGTRMAIGIEIEPDVADAARQRIAEAGLSESVKILKGDATTYDVKADIGVAYLWPETLAKLRPQIEKLDRFVSYAHAVPGLPMRQVGDVFVYEKPAPVAMQPVMMQQPRPAGAVWGGRVYSGPVCRRANCAMCNAIRMQLGMR